MAASFVEEAGNQSPTSAQHPYDVTLHRPTSLDPC